MSDSGKQKLKAGVDWHGWAWQYPDGMYDTTIQEVGPMPPAPDTLLNLKGKWVKVRFVEVN